MLRCLWLFSIQSEKQTYLEPLVVGFETSQNQGGPPTTSYRTTSYGVSKP
jgi:hypothetical protein